MSQFSPALITSVLGLALFCVSGAAEAEEAPKPPPPALAPLEVDGATVNDLSDIEDASIESLLDLSLEDKLGTTEAVSRTIESVLRAPATMTTLDATRIRLSGATSVAEVLRSVPGVAVVRNAPGNYVVSLRGTGGLAGNNVILLVDGIPLNSPLDGTVSWELMPLHVEDIERIEVVRGPVSPTYGANAYTGVINIVTRTTLGLSPAYVARLRGGSDLNGGIAVLGSGRFLHVARGYELKAFLNVERDGTATTPASGDAVGNDAPPLERIAALTELVFVPNASSRLALEVGQVWSSRSGMDHLALTSEAQGRHMLFGRAVYDLHSGPAPLRSLRLWGQGVSFHIEEGEAQAREFSYAGAKSFRAAVGTDGVLAVGPYFSVLLGAQSSVERVDARFVHPNVDGQLRPTYGFYAGIKAEATPWLDVAATGRGDLSPISDEIEYSYRASVIYHSDTWGARLTGASSFRSPTYIEASGRFVDPSSGLILLEGTDTLGAPRNTSLELGATFSPHPTLTVSPTVYLSQLDNLMVEEFDSVVRRSFQNDTDHRNLLGAELEAHWHPLEAMTVLPSFTWLEWLSASEGVDTNVGVPGQNARYVAGLQVYGLFAEETWGYGVGGTLTAPRSYGVRTGIPPLVLSKDLPATARITATLEHLLMPASSLWGSLRLGASLPGDTPESPLPRATPLGQTILLGLELRHQ